MKNLNTNSTPRTCPHCAYKYSRMEYVKKLFFKTLWSHWECSNCNQQITFDSKQRVLTALVFGCWIFVLNMATRFLKMDLVLWFLFGVVFLFGSVFIFSFDTFKSLKKEV